MSSFSSFSGTNSKNKNQIEKQWTCVFLCVGTSSKMNTNPKIEVTGYIQTIFLGELMVGTKKIFDRQLNAQQIK